MIFGETVFEEMIEQLGEMTVQIRWIILFLFIMLFKGTGVAGLLREMIKLQKEQSLQNEQILQQLERLKSGTLSAYEAQYATAKALQIRADAVAEKRGEKPESVLLPSPSKVREVLELWIDSKPSKDK